MSSCGGNPGEGVMPTVDWMYIGLLATLAVVAVSILRAI
jgi:hypothetical protein